MKLRNKNKKNFAISFFLFYSFFTVFAFFHNHSINFPDRNSLVLHQNESSGHFFDPFMDSDSVCQLYQFSTVKILPEIGLSPDFSLLRIDTSIQISDAHQYLTNTFSDSNLRAPPTAS